MAGRVTQPYMFEPEKQSKDGVGEAEESGSLSDVTKEDDLDLDWCTCGECRSMPTRAENVCCQDYTPVLEKLQEFTEHHNLEEDVGCITMHEGFSHNCLSVYVLERDLARMRLQNEEEEELIHETYRHIAYRNFVTWIWHILGKKNRIVLPACVVSKIRQTFPSESTLYCGFKYPQPTQ